MSKVTFKINRNGVRELLKSEFAMTTCEDYANGVANRAGDGYNTTRHVGRNRVNVSVGAETQEARRDNLENNTLLKAVGGGR